MVGTRSPEAETARRQAAFHFRGEPRKLAQELFVAITIARHVIGERGQRAFDRQHPWRLAPRDRQRQQGHHAIGLDLEEPLHQTAGLARRQGGVEQDEAGAAIIVDAEVGEGIAGALAEGGANGDIAIEVLGHSRDVRGALGGLRELRMGGNHGRAGNACQPPGRQEAHGRFRERPVRQARDEEGVAGELAVAFPLEAQGAEAHAEVRGVHAGWCHVEAFAQGGHVAQFALALLRVDQHGQI